MEAFSALLALCAGNSPVPVNSPHKGQWLGALMFSLICAWINDWVNNREAGDLRRHRGHYDVIVMAEPTTRLSGSLRGCSIAIGGKDYHGFRGANRSQFTRAVMSRLYSKVVFSVPVSGSYYCKIFHHVLLWFLHQLIQSIYFRITSLVLGSLQWRHNGRDGISNHRLHHCLLKRLVRRR